MDRYMIVIPAKNRAFNMKCDDGDSMKLETLQKLVGPAVVAAKRGDELIGFAKPVVETICAEWL
ncbi:hypothetical protein [Faecalibacterium prausnitzii]|uniref:hypothetical protein n=1 Tax=Faecalibacterium prausnitzii TaxID=853 RepID=UPI0012DD7393|nr:hypothetical protein [Faecalibacterium prausnitzii]